MTWLRAEQTELAVDAILDAAGELFLERGVNRTGMTEIARAAGCSRATLYRYFPNRDDLRRAYVHREAIALGRRVRDAVAGIADPSARTTAAVLETLRLVRATPTLAAWFTSDDYGLAHRLASSSEVVAAIAGGAPGDDGGLAARFVVRVVVSLLAAPADPAEERAIVERFLVAPLTADAGG
jgi:AcrR family transcriptional regulator